MSDLNKLARPYAKAIFEYAIETKGLVEWETILATLAEVSQNADIQKILLNPSLSREVKQEIILEVAKLKDNTKLANLIDELGYQKRLALLGAIYKLYLAYKNEQEGKLEVEVISAFELDKTQIENLRMALEKRYERKMDLSVKLDSSLIGGLIIRLGDMIIDSSVKGRLSKLAEVLQKQ